MLILSEIDTFLVVNGGGVGSTFVAILPIDIGTGAGACLGELDDGGVVVGDESDELSAIGACFAGKFDTGFIDECVVDDDGISAELSSLIAAKTGGIGGGGSLEFLK